MMWKPGDLCTTPRLTWRERIYEVARVRQSWYFKSGWCAHLKHPALLRELQVDLTHLAPVKPAASAPAQAVQLYVEKLRACAPLRGKCPGPPRRTDRRICGRPAIVNGRCVLCASREQQKNQNERPAG